MSAKQTELQASGPQVPRATTPFDRPMERRGGRRHPYHAPVRIYLAPYSVEDSFTLDSSDVCPEGVFLHSELLFPVGEWLDLEFQVPGRPRPVRGRGRVVRVDGDRRAPGPGMAVWIPGLSVEERSALGRLSATAVRAVPGPRS